MKHGLQRRLPSKVKKIILALEFAVLGEVFYLRLYLESRKTNSVRNSAMTLTSKPIVVITMDRIS